jgi:flagellar basal body-associated protein FliL
MDVLKHLKKMGKNKLSLSPKNIIAAILGVLLVVAAAGIYLNLHKEATSGTSEQLSESHQEPTNVAPVTDMPAVSSSSATIVSTTSTAAASTAVAKNITIKSVTPPKIQPVSSSSDFILKSRLV